MKKVIILLSLLFLPVFASATIDQNLYYGLMRNDSVRELQQYLIDGGFMIGRATGNFYSVTLSSVKKYQASKNIITTGYVGPLTRKAINDDLSSISNLPAEPAVSVSNPAPAPLTGSLALAQNTAYPSQSATAPRSKFKLADFSLTNNTTEAVNLKTIQVDLAVGSELYAANLYVSNLYVVYGSSKTSVLITVSHNNYWSIDYQLPAGQAVNLSVYGDVNSSIPLNLNINSGMLVTGTAAVSAVAVNTNSSAILSGQSITFGAGSLTAVKDSATPASKIATANQRVVAGKFQFTATGDSYTISELKFIVSDPRAVSIISGAVLSDTATQVSLTPRPISVSYSGGEYMLDFDINIPVSLNSSRYITVYYDLGSSVYSNNTNMDISPVLAYVKAVNSRGALIDGAAADYNNISTSYGGITLPSYGVTVNSLYIFKSTPTFTAAVSNTSASSGSEVNLYTFSIGADINGDISVKQLMFNIVITDPDRSYPHLNDFRLLKGDSDYTGSVAIGNNVNNNYIGLTRDGGIGIGTNTVIVTFNREETIPAGKTQTYTLKARVSNFTLSPTLGADSISTYIPADAAISTSGRYLRMAFIQIYGLAQTAVDIYVTSYNILWSDRSAIAFYPHSDLNGYSTGDWYNGFGVLNFPLSSQTITAK